LFTVDIEKPEHRSVQSFSVPLVELLKPGQKQSLTLVNSIGIPVTTSVTLRCETLKPPSNSDCSVRLSTKLSKDKIAEGEAMKLKVEVTNVRNLPLGMTLACVGIPAGLQPRIDKIKVRWINTGQCMLFLFFLKKKNWFWCCRS